MEKALKRLAGSILAQLTPILHLKKMRGEIFNGTKSSKQIKQAALQYEAALRLAHKRLARNLSLITILFIPAMIVGVYILQKNFNPTYGQDVSIEYYSVVAQLLAALLLALFLTGHPIIKASYSDEFKSLIDESIWVQMVTADRLPSLMLFSLGEASCLVAIARDSSGALLFITSGVSIIMLTLLVAGKILRTQ